MNLFGKKKEQLAEISNAENEEQILKESLEKEVEELQIKFRTYQEDIKNITKKLESVKDEYESAVNNLMNIKKEINLEKMELDSLQRDHKVIKSKINDATETMKNRNPSNEYKDIESNIKVKKQELENFS